MTKTFKQIRELIDLGTMRQRHRGGSKGAPGLLNYGTMKRHSRDSTSGSLTDKQIQNLKKTWNNPSKVFTKDAEQFVKNMVKKLDNDSRYRLAKAGIKHISKLAESGDVPKGHEYGPSSRKRPAGKAGYTSSDSARTTHLKTVKRDAKKKRRQGDKKFANESLIDNVKKAVEIAKKMAGNMTGAEKEIEKIQKGLSKHIRVADALRLANEEAPANATGTAVAGTGDDSSTVVVKKKKEQQSKLMKRITDSIDKALPNPIKEEDEITTRKNQLKELAKNRTV